MPIPSKEEIEVLKKRIKDAIVGFNGEINITVGPYRLQDLSYKITDDLSRIDIDLYSVNFPQSYYEHEFNFIKEVVFKLNTLVAEANFIKKINDLESNLNSIMSWIENLPFPLATILRVFDSTNDIGEKIEHLLNFFEALSEFIVLINLSVYKDDEKFFNQEFGKIKLLKSNSIAKPTINTWTQLGMWFAKSLRRIKSGIDKSKWEKIRKLFGNPDERFLELMMGKEIFKELEIIRKYRNDWKGHSGIKPKHNELKRRLDLLESILEKSKQKVLDSFKNMFLVTPINMKLVDNEFSILVNKLTGSIYPFKEIEILTIKPMKQGKLYIFNKNNKIIIELLPLIKISPSSEKTANTCFFYNRISGKDARYVSYHNKEKAEIMIPTNELESLFKLLERIVIEY